MSALSLNPVRSVQTLCRLLALIALTWLSACSDSPAPAPVISVQPSDTSAVAGTAATLSVMASGPDLAYQWQQSSDGGASWADIAGATQAGHTTAATTAADNGKRFRVIVSAAGIGMTSSAVTLTVTAAVVAPALTVQPAAQSVIAPGAATFSVTATGTAPAYQWQRSTDNGSTWTPIAGASATTYSTAATDVSMNASQYRVVVGNSAGSVTSAAVVLTVAAAPLAAAIATQPVDQSVGAGSAAAFTVAAAGNPTPTVQWQRSTDNGATWNDIAAATDAIYNTGPTTLAQNGERFRARASNSAGSATSNAALLSVSAAAQAPAISTQPTDQLVTSSATATFTASASGVPTPTWQWQLSSDGGTTWANVNGATSASYNTPVTTVADNGRRFRALASNSAGTATSRAALLTVTAPSNRMLAARLAHTATLLANGKVLVAAGVVNASSGGFYSSAETFDPTTALWSAAASLSTARGYHTATRLADGRVLVVGGQGANPGGAPIRLATAELYDPVSNTWSAAGSLATARAHHSATLLASGKVLVAGGSTSSGTTASAELFDPATLAWSSAGDQLEARQDHAAVRLADGRIMLVGGGNNFVGSLASTALYDPSTNSWGAAASMAQARNYVSATVLPNGKVLAVGGYDQLGIGTVASAELYDPASNSWSAAGSLAQGRYAHSAAVLPSGRVLVAAGFGSTVLATAELYDPASNAWSTAAGLARARYLHAAAVLANGDLLLSGGIETGSAPTASAEVYDAVAASWK